MDKRNDIGPQEDPPPGCGTHEHGRRREGGAFGAGDFERAGRMLRVAGDAQRLRLLEMLSRGEMCVTEIASVTGEGLSTVSQRLRLLLGEDLVVRRREGKRVFYALSDGHVADVILSVLGHAAHPEVGRQKAGTQTLRTGETSMTERLHEGHGHVHGPGCGHTAVGHDGHTDYLHDGHLHHQREDGTVEEHAVPVSAANPDAHNDHEAEHPVDHEHGPGCGHEAVPHGDHTDYLVEGHLHHPHGGHCDDHGPVEVTA